MAESFDFQTLSLVSGSSEHDSDALSMARFELAGSSRDTIENILP